MDNDLTIIYYTANFLPENFLKKMQAKLLESANGIPIISVSHKPIDFGTNICVGDIGRSAYNIYKQVLIGAKAATTEFVCTAEDDCLYPPEHFQYRPAGNIFAYDTNKWQIFSWTQPPFFSYKPRRNMTSLIVRRQALIDTLEERFARWPDPDKIPVNYFGEPGRFELHLGITGLENERFAAAKPQVMFCTEKSLAFEHLGTRKAHSRERAFELDPWGTAEDVLRYYTG